MSRLVVLLIAAALPACGFDVGGLPVGPPSNGGDAAPPDGPPGPTDGEIVDASVDAPPPPPDAPVPVDAPPPPPDAPPPPTLDCPDGYVTVPGSRSAYRVSEGLRRWRGAEADCESDGDGTHLVVIDDPAELVQVSTLVGGGDVWVGVDDRIAEDVWLTVLGDLAEFLPWAATEPNDDGNEDCVELRTATRTYNDRECAFVGRYVCECDGLEPDRRTF